MEESTVASEEARLKQLEQDIEERKRIVGRLERFVDEKTLAKHQQVLASKVEERALILEQRRVAAVVRSFEEQHPQVSEDCPICLEPMRVHIDEAVSRLVCCGKCTCRECAKPRNLEKCPLCQANMPAREDVITLRVMPRAEQGCAWAQVLVGYHYAKEAEKATSMSVRKFNKENSFKWYRKAANQGNCTAQAVLGKIYYSDESLVVSQSFGKARHFLETAAKKGHTEAQAMLGIMCEKGQGAPVDREQAAYWWTLSAANGHPLAECFLGIYFMGEEGGLQKCWNCSKYYLEKAVMAGNESARFPLSTVLWGLGEERYGSNFIPGHSCVPRCLYWIRKAIPEDDGEVAEFAGRIEWLEGYAKSRCANCLKTREACGRELNCCSRCQAAWYCGKECQKKHWKAGHKVDCFSG